MLCFASLGLRIALVVLHLECDRAEWVHCWTDCWIVERTYTAVVDNLDDGSELASEGAAADQDEAANLDQLPRSERDIDIGHGGILRMFSEVQGSSGPSTGVVLANSRSTTGFG